MLTGKIAIVTGGVRGIGRAIAETFCENGATVVIADQDRDEAPAVVSDIGQMAEAVSCDVSDEADVEAMVRAVVERYGRIDVLVNNAGIIRDAMMHRMELAQFREVIDVHLQGTWLCTREVLRHMRMKSAGGAIVNVSSTSGKTGNLGQTNYSSAKAGIVGLTKSAALEAARFGVRVNAIQPGLIATGMTEKLPANVWQQKLAGIPLRRAGLPSEVAAVALFLASDMATYITGAVIEVAGGRAM